MSGRRLLAGGLAGVCAVLLSALAWAQEQIPATLRVSVEPAAMISLNYGPRSPMGTSYVKQVPGDEAILIKVEAPGYVTAYRTVRLRGGERRAELFALKREPIPVLFRANTDATVLLNGAELGETPFHYFFTEPKMYRIVVRAPGFVEQVLNLNLGDGEPKVVDASLVANHGTLQVASTPSAKVFLNGVERGKTPVTLERLQAGEHTLTLKADGFQPLVHKVSVEMGATVPLNLTLEPLPSGLTVTTIPNEARVYVDDQFRGNSDLTLTGLGAGMHTLRVEKVGFATEHRTITLARGEAKVEEIRLDAVRGTLALKTQPAEVEVYQGSTKLLTTSPASADSYTSRPAMLSLIPGNYVFTFKASGYAPATRSVSVAANQTTKLSVSLDFKPNFELTTSQKTYRGVFRKKSESGSITLELRPGTFRTFSVEEIQSQRLLTEAL